MKVQLLFGAMLLLAGSLHAETVSSHRAGTLANSGFEGESIKSVYFFAGQWRTFPNFGPFYDGPVPGIKITPASNDCLYTVWPVNGGQHLGWSDTEEKRHITLNQMITAGVNVVNMSYWGPPDTDRWAFWAPMQTATGSHDELFDAAIGKRILIVPAIESSIKTLGEQQNGCWPDRGEMPGPVGQSPGFDLLDDFPGTPSKPAPQLIEQIVDLVNRYLLNAAKPEWREKWAQMYDLHGTPRYVITLIHVGSNQQHVDDTEFAKAFALVADRVHARTGVRVGFALDTLPREHDARFKPTPSGTGHHLAQQPAVLAIQPFISEVFSGRCRIGEECDAEYPSRKLDGLLDWKHKFIREWVRTGVPVIADVSPGYDARYVFPDGPRYGNNRRWREGQEDLLKLGVRGIIGNTWNGFTEGFAILPSCGTWPRGLGPPGLLPCDELNGDPSNEAYLWFSELSLH